MKPLHPWFRSFLSTARLLLLAAGLLLFAFPDRTALLFAWTIRSNLMAATLGGFYLALALFAYRDVGELRATPGRGAVPVLLVFSSFTAAAAFLHLSQLHLESRGPLSRGIAWAWLLTFALQAPALLVLGARQWRRLGAQEPRGAAPPAWFRLVLALLAFAALWDGIALFFIAPVMSPLWPWPVTPLNARALAAGYFGLATAGLWAALASDWSRIRSAMLPFVCLSILALLAALRFRAEIRWSAPAAEAYMIFMIGSLAAGLYGAREAQRVSLKFDSAAGRRRPGATDLL